MFCARDSEHPMGSRWENAGGAIVLIGIGLIFLLGIGFWPWILFVVAVPALLGGIARGGLWAGMQGAVWLVGIGVIALFNIWWPGILILIGISMLVGMVEKPPVFDEKRKRKRGLPVPDEMYDEDEDSY